MNLSTLASVSSSTVVMTTLVSTSTTAAFPSSPTPSVAMATSDLSTSYLTGEMATNQTELDIFPTTDYSLTTLMGNSSDANPVFDVLRKFNTILLPVLMVVIMTSIGCLVTIQGLRNALRRPVGIIIGFAGQFVLLPLLAFCMALALNLEAPHALGMMMVATSPGGVSSSLFVYWMNGNICLSLCMSTIATLAAVGMMPLNLFIYSRYWEEAQIRIPYVEIISALALVLIPVVIGLVIRHKKEEWTKYIIKLGSVLGLVAIVVNMVIYTIVNNAIFAASYSVWLCAVFLPFLSFGLAYTMAWLLRQDHTNCRTIAVETTSQNVALTLAIIGVTFGGQELDALIVYPTIYSVFLILDGLIMVPVYWLGVWYVLPRIKRVIKDTNISKDDHDNQKFDPTAEPELRAYNRNQSQMTEISIV